MDYDAIAGREGCEVESGNDWFGLKAFTEMCVFPHDPAHEIFSMPLTVSYSFGPATKGDPTHPYLTEWAVWVATLGVRVGKTSHVVPPANTIGEPSTLYLNDKPPELTHSWNVKGDLAIAIQKDTRTIELKQYLDDEGNIITRSWSGRSPALFYSGHVIHGDSGIAQLVCYYLKDTGSPTILYARFESEDWAVEHIVMPSMRVGLSRLISVTHEDTKVLLYARDDRDRDVLLTTPEHPALFDKDVANLVVSFTSGSAHLTAVDGTNPEVPPFDGLRAVDIKLASGKVFKSLVDITTPTVDSTSLSVALVGGEVTT